MAGLSNIHSTLDARLSPTHSRMTAVYSSKTDKITGISHAVRIFCAGDETVQH
jgi:hypothetical protein